MAHSAHPSHSDTRAPDNRVSREREATELSVLDSREGDEDGLANPGTALPTSNGGISSTIQPSVYYTTISTFWKRQVAIMVSHDSCRDHFGMVLFHKSISQCKERLELWLVLHVPKTPFLLVRCLV